MTEDEKPLADRRKAALDHAWGWFSLHSTQRLQAVNFFLVAIAFLSAAFVTAAKEKLLSVAIGVAALAVIVSFLFYRMERRIRSLIHAAEDAMKPLQSELAKALGVETLELCNRVEQVKSGDWKYSEVFRYLYFTTGVAFALAIVWATWAQFSTTAGATEFNLVLQALIAVFLVGFGQEMLTLRSERERLDGAATIARWLQPVLGAFCILVGIGIFVKLGL